MVYLYPFIQSKVSSRFSQLFKIHFHLDFVTIGIAIDFGSATL